MGLGIKGKALPRQALKRRLSEIKFDDVETRFLNQDAMISMLNFGKGELDAYDSVEASNELNLAVYHYYKNGAWDLY